MTSPVQILLVGASGRMGREVALSVERHAKEGKAISIVGGIADASDPQIGLTLSGIKGKLQSDWSPEFKGANVIIDFSGPGGTAKALTIAKQEKIPLLICTTGLSDDTRAKVKATGEVVPFIVASNTSVGVNAMLRLVSDATKMLGKNFDVEISEIHHKMKKDAPSGTALSLAESIASARGEDLKKIIHSGRTGAEALRKSGELGINAIRGGDIVGEHTVFYFGNGERLEITHRATSRSIFADGAIRAATWLVEQAAKGLKAGSYSMQDVLS